MTVKPETSGGIDPEIEDAIADFDISQPAWSTKFYQMQDVMRQRCPVLHSPHQSGYYVLTSHADILQVLRDHETYSSSGGVFLTPLPGNQTLIPTDMDPPLQRDFRRLVDKHLSAAAVAPLEEDITDTAQALVDDFIDDGECDLYRDFATILPNQVFLRHVLGVTGDQEDAANEQVELAMSSETLEEVEAGFRGLGQWCADLLESRRVGDTAKAGLIHALLDGKVDQRALTPEEQVSTLMSVTIGGLETASSVISAGVVALIENPDQQRRLREDPSLIPAAVEEIARFGSPTALMRTVTRETVLNDKTLQPGDRVLIVFGAANRDPSVFDAPHDFDIDRSNADALSFGTGMHRCPGSNLARMVLRVAITTVLDRMDDLRLLEEVDWTASQIRSPKSLRIAFTPSS